MTQVQAITPVGFESPRRTVDARSTAALAATSDPASRSALGRDAVQVTPAVPTGVPLSFAAPPAPTTRVSGQVSPGASLGVAGCPGDTGVAGAIVARSAALAQAHQHPIVVFDLDDTLFQTAPRHKAILAAWAQTPAGAPYAAAIAALPVERISYDIGDTAKTLGIPDALVPGLKQFWADRFFTSEYVQYDTPNPGAVAYANALQQAGAEVVYLTGRSETMGDGTEKALKAFGFPWNPQHGSTALMLKATAAQHDVDFKAAASRSIAATGTVVASIDNEPANVNMFHDVLPEATTVLLGNVHSPNPAPLHAGIAVLAAFPTADCP